MSFDEIRAEVRANTRHSARMLVYTLRLAQRYRGRKIAGALSGLLHRAVSRALFCDIPPETAIAHGLRIERAFFIIIDPCVRIGARCLLRHGVTLSSEGNAAPVIGHDVEFGCYAVVTGDAEVADGSRVKPLSLTSA
jgi:serine acetyltransferase